MIEAVKTYNDLPVNPEDGRTIFVEELGKVFRYVNNEWTEEKENENAPTAQLTLYELNRQMVSQLPNFEESQWEGAEKVFADWTDPKKNEYFLLYGREINYFTLFKRNEYNSTNEKLFDCVKECFKHIGPVKAFDVTEDEDAVEIWAEYEGVTTCLYLFEYDDGVIPCEW